MYNCNENLDCKCLTEHIWTEHGMISPPGTPSSFGADFMTTLETAGLDFPIVLAISVIEIPKLSFKC